MIFCHNVNVETLGNKLKYLREEKQLTQIELAKILNIDRSTIAKYETDAATPSVSMLIVLARFFDVTADYLLGLDV